MPNITITRREFFEKIFIYAVNFSKFILLKFKKLVIEMKNE